MANSQAEALAALLGRKLTDTFTEDDFTHLRDLWYQWLKDHGFGIAVDLGRPFLASVFQGAVHPWVGKRFNELTDADFAPANDLIRTTTSGVYGLGDWVTGKPPDEPPTQSGVDNVVSTAQATLDVLAKLGTLLSAQGLALIGGAILLYLGFKYIMNANNAPSTV